MQDFPFQWGGIASYKKKIMYLGLDAHELLSKAKGSVCSCEGRFLNCTVSTSSSSSVCHTQNTVQT